MTAEFFPHSPTITSSGEESALRAPAVTESTQQETIKLHGYAKVAGARQHIPWTAELPTDELAYEGMTLLVPGFGGFKRSSRAERHANAVQGRPTISYDPVRVSGNVIHNLSQAQTIHTRAAEAVLFAVNQRLGEEQQLPNKDRLDTCRAILSAHSMGGYAATDLALKYPGYIESVIYKGAAGFGTLPITDLDPIGFGQEVAQFVKSGEMEPNLRNLYRVIRYYARKPSRTAGEALTCLSVDKRPAIAKLGELGVGRGYLAFENDPLVSAKRAERNTEGFVDAFVTMGGVGHLAPQMYAHDTAVATWDLQQRLEPYSKPYSLDLIS